LGHLPFQMLQAQPEQIAVKGERPVEVSNLDGDGVDPSKLNLAGQLPLLPIPQGDIRLRHSGAH
jgi:hypothetical protein